MRRKIAGRVKVAHLRYYLGAAPVGRSCRHRRQRASPAARASSRPVVRVSRRRSLPPPPPRQPPAPAPKPVSAEDNAPPAQSPAALPPARPADAAETSALSVRSDRAICWPGKPTSDASRLILAAQTALAKLGYAVKPDGKEGAATEQALREFERAHGLPPATEITERLVKQLTHAARGGGH